MMPVIEIDTSSSISVTPCSGRVRGCISATVLRNENRLGLARNCLTNGRGDLLHTLVAPTRAPRRHFAGSSPFQYLIVGPAEKVKPVGRVTDEYDDAELT